MSTVSKQYYEEDQVPTAAELNAPYDSLATASNNIDDDNTAAGWITLAHIDTSLNRANRLFSLQNDTTTTSKYTSTSYTTITDGVTPASLTLNYLPEQFEVIRFQGSGLVTTVDCNDDYDNVGANKGKPNYYAFRMLLTYDDGAGDVTTTVGNWGYSLTTNGYDRYYTAGVSPGNQPEIQYQTFQFSGVIRYEGGAGTRTYKKLEMQIALFSGSNQVDITRYQMQVVRPIR